MAEQQVLFMMVATKETPYIEIIQGFDWSNTNNCIT